MKEMRDYTIYMIGHGHIDPTWLWRWTEGYEEARSDVSQRPRPNEGDPGLQVYGKQRLLLRLDQGMRSGNVRRDPRACKGRTLGCRGRLVDRAGLQHSRR